MQQGVWRVRLGVTFEHAFDLGADLDRLHRITQQIAHRADIAGMRQFNQNRDVFGGHIGIRVEGVLTTMAGERMRFDRFVEISAVCVDLGHRGKSYAAVLTARIARRLQAQAPTPILHVFADNANAIALYEKLGFARRRTLQMTVLRSA
jgi:predicted GNAT family acetyltransferase